MIRSYIQTDFILAKIKTNLIICIYFEVIETKTICFTYTLENVS